MSETSYDVCNVGPALPVLGSASTSIWPTTTSVSLSLASHHTVAFISPPLFFIGPSRNYGSQLFGPLVHMLP